MGHRAPMRRTMTFGLAIVMILTCSGAQHELKIVQGSPPITRKKRGVDRRLSQAGLRSMEGSRGPLQVSRSGLIAASRAGGDHAPGYASVLVLDKFLQLHRHLGDPR